MTKKTGVRIVLAMAVAFFMGWFVATIVQTATQSAPSESQEIEETSRMPAFPERDFALQTPAQYDNRLDYTSDEDVNITVYELRNKSVVNITTEVLAYNWFFEPVPQEGGIGSGSIIDDRGYILTNYHVVENANKVFVTMWDGSKIEGEVIGVDSENDLAIIKVDPKGISFVAVPIGDSLSLKVGQKVLAIGNPFGLDRTLTTGIISGLGRPVRSSANIVIQNMIQTDASINPGNSGGPLLNSEGKMIGVNTIILTPSRGSVGVGFAVPSATVKRIVPDLIEYGTVKRGWIEWSVRPLFKELVQYAKLPVDKGLLVTEVKSRGNADKVGIKGGSSRNAVRYGRTTILLGGDIVASVNAREVTSISDYLEALEATHAGDAVEIVYYRGKKSYTATVTLIERPKDLVIE